MLFESGWDRWYLATIGLRVYIVILRILFMLFWSPMDFRGTGVTGYYWLMKGKLYYSRHPPISQRKMIHPNVLAGAPLCFLFKKCPISPTFLSLPQFHPLIIHPNQFIDLNSQCKSTTAWTNNFSVSTAASTKSTTPLIQISEGVIRLQKVHLPPLSISDNVFLPTQPELPAPNDAYEPVHLPKHNILEESLKR